MSTKIWTAYRIRRSDTTSTKIDPWQTCIRLQREATERARKTLWNSYVRLEAFARTDAKFRKGTGLDQINLPSRISRFVQKQYQAQIVDPQRNIYHLDVSFTVRRVGGRYLIIPYADGIMRDVFQTLAQDEHLEDYHYQDQVDRPKHITASEWRRRRNTWEVADQEWNSFATFEVLNLDRFPHVDPVWHRAYVCQPNPLIRWNRDVNGFIFKSMKKSKRTKK